MDSSFPPSEPPSNGNGHADMLDRHDRLLYGDDTRSGIVQEIAQQRGALVDLAGVVYTYRDEVRQYSTEHAQALSALNAKLDEISAKLTEAFKWMAARP
jgi:hypothetical protein